MNIALLLIINHFIADFILQSDKMAINKSKSNVWLGYHVFVYTLGMAYISGIYIESISGIFVAMAWLILNGFLHAVTDYFSSRLTSYLWQKQMRHWFFVAIGFDQVIHYVCLIKTWELLVR